LNLAVRQSCSVFGEVLSQVERGENQREPYMDLSHLSQKIIVG